VDVRFGNVMDMEALKSTAFKDKVDVVVSCLASRTGVCVCVLCSCVHTCISHTCVEPIPWVGLAPNPGYTQAQILTHLSSTHTHTYTHTRTHTHTHTHIHTHTRAHTHTHTHTHRWQEGQPDDRLPSHQELLRRGTRERHLPLCPAECHLCAKARAGVPACQA